MSPSVFQPKVFPGTSEGRKTTGNSNSPEIVAQRKSRFLLKFNLRTIYCAPYASNLLLVVYLYSVVAVCTFVFLNFVFFNDCYRIFDE